MSLLKPKYLVKIQQRNGKYVRNVTGHVTELYLIDEETELAYRAEVKLADTVLSSGKRLSTKFRERDILKVYVKTGDKYNLLFYGTIWQINKTAMDKNEVKLTAYDPLIYLQKSEAALFFGKNKKTKTIMKSVCNKLGLKLVYNYYSVRHGKIQHRGTYADLITDTLMGKVRKSTGVKGIFRYQKGKVYAQPVGFNNRVYTIELNKTGLSAEYASTMDDMVTRVKIVNDKKTKATISGNTKKWGVIQQVQDKGKEKLSESKKIARQTIKSHGKPKRRWKVEALDIPYIRKGHKVIIKGSIMAKHQYIVMSVTHNFHEKKMELEVARLATKKKSKKKSKGKYKGEIPKSTLKKGSKGKNVKKLQKFLNWYGKYGLSVDGKFGNNTKKALKKFQKSEGLAQNGVYNKKTYTKVKSYK